MTDPKLAKATALALARAAEFAGVDAVLLVGSHARGEAQRNSDIDIIIPINSSVPWSAPVRDGGRESSVDAQGRQVELAFISGRRARQKLADGAAAGQRFLFEWLVEAQLLGGAGLLFRALRAEAEPVLAEGPAPLPERELRWRCYELWNALKDVDDSAGDPATAVRLAFSTFENFLHFAFEVHRAWMPRPKAVMRELEQVDETVHRMALRFVVEASVSGRHAVLTEMRLHFEGLTGLRFDASYTSGPPPRAGQSRIGLLPAHPRE